MRAFCLIREQPWYRRQAFTAGLRAAGYQVAMAAPNDDVKPGDVLVIWNRYADNHERASRFERQGGTVLVAENGYLGEGGTAPKFDVHPGGPQPHHYYALARGWHNGRGSWPAGGPERFAALRVQPQPMMGLHEGHVLVCPNRSFGVGEQVMHPDWAERTAARVQKDTGRKAVIRRHPGNDRPKRELAADLQGACAVAIWSSGAGVHALVAGLPVFCDAPFWICKQATLPTAALGGFDGSGRWDREAAERTRAAALERMAWAQWQVREIESGEALRWMLQ